MLYIVAKCIGDYVHKTVHNICHGGKIYRRITCIKFAKVAKFIGWHTYITIDAHIQQIHGLLYTVCNLFDQSDIVFDKLTKVILTHKILYAICNLLFIFCETWNCISLYHVQNVFFYDITTHIEKRREKQGNRTEKNE